MGIRPDLDRNLIQQLQQEGWQLKIGSTIWLIVAPNRIEARLFYHKYLPLLVEMRDRLECIAGIEEIKIAYPGGRKPYRVVPDLTGEIPMSLIQSQFNELVWISSDLGVTYPLLKALESVCESTTLAGISRTSDHRQVVINQRLAAALPCSPQDAVKRDVRNFTLAADLEEIERETRQNEEFVISYRTALDDEKQVWRRLTNRYRVVLDRFGTKFRVGEVLDVQEISRPVGV